MFKIRTTIIATVFLGLAVAGTAQAAVEHLNLPVCNLAVYPLNSTKPELYGDAANAFVNFLSEATCKARTTYGQAYNQPPTKAQNPLASVANIEEKNVPYAQHYHAYINNALEDSYYYRSFVDKFEITLESDALTNMDKYDVQCVTPAPGTYGGSASELADCNGQINDTSFYGGVKVSYNSTTGVITWEFGTVDKNKRPNMWGNNDSNPSDSDNFDETLEAVYGVPANLSDYTSVYRRFRPSVVLHTKNNPQEIWSATTTSRALIRNYAILKSSFNAIPNNNLKFSSLCSALGDFTKWCPVATPSGEGYATENYGSQEWFWFPIGSVVSVWRQPPPPVDLACEDLQWDGPFLKKNSVGVFSPAITNPNALLQNEEALMKFKTIYQSGSGTKRPLEYHWVSFYGDQNRPAWFTNQDGLFLMPIIPIITTSLPAKLLNVAHAAPLTPGSSSDSIVSASDISIDTSIKDSILNLGKFKDEIASSLSYNPLVDDDLKAYYSGGSEGITLGVQAFYADGKNVAGQGDMVQTSQGLKQKANKCHLELTIQPPPAVCIDLDISPKDIKPNTPVTFTVTPKFSPADKVIPLNYEWTASKGSGLDYMGIDAVDITDAISKASGSSSSWAVDGLIDVVDTGSYLGNLGKLPCPGAGCPTTKPGKFDPLGPVEAGSKIDTGVSGNLSPSLGSIGTSIGGANIFTEFSKPSEYGKAALMDFSISDTMPGLSTGPAFETAPDFNLGTGSSDKIDLDGATSDEITYGGFKDFQGAAPTPANPFLETTDNKTWYTGGPGGTVIKVQGKAKDGTIYPLCKETLTIPETPVLPICKALNLTTNPSLIGGQIPLNTQIALTADPRDTDNNPREPIVYEKTGSGVFIINPTNASSCPVPSNAAGLVTFEAPSSCKYSFLATTASSGDYLSVKVKQDDGVADCKATMPIKTAPPSEICLALNFRVNGSYTLNPLITAGQSYSLSADPQTTLGNPIGFVEWTENGPGKLVGEASNPAICPAAIDNGIVTTPSFCRYIYSSPSGSTGIGFSARAVPDDSNPNCMAKAEGYTPPESTPYCLYLDLDTSGTFNPLTNNNMNATVVMSDGSKYNDNVRFVSTDGNGNFTGGYGSTSGSGTYNFKTQTDSLNNTHNVTFSNGIESTGINVMLADTSITQTAACQRSLFPTVKPPEECTEPPTIVKKTGNQYCAEGGNSKSYCWSISGSGNPLFSNGSKSSTGTCVNLNSAYSDFKLEVEDCNPKYANLCYDVYKKDDKPSIEKRISEISASGYGRSVSMSTNGKDLSGKKIYYQIKFEPKNYVDGKRMNARIIDPAFDGIIYGYKYKSTDKASGIQADQLNVNKNDIKVSQGSTASTATSIPNCPSSFDPEKDLGNGPCFRYETQSKYQNGNSNSNGTAMVIYGIDSNKTIWINYFGSVQKNVAGLTQKDCQDGVYCLEQFYNQSYVTDMEYCEQITITNPDGTTSIKWDCTNDNSKPDRCEYYVNEQGIRVLINGKDQDCKENNLTLATPPTFAEIVCQYFLTRASGDIFLEDQLKYGIDVSKCYPFKNISSTITKPIPPTPQNLIKTGTESGTTVSISHEICSAGQTGFNALGLKPAQKQALSQLYGADLTNLSSQICEVGLVPGVQWTKEQISQAIQQNVSKLTRWDSGAPKSATLNFVQDIKDAGGVYYFNGGDISGNKLTISGLDIKDGDGPLTIIVENADLEVTGDIKYSAGTVNSTSDLASLGVIVLNGNMYVSNNVKELDGAYFIQRTDTTDLTKGNVLSKEAVDTENLLTVSGSIFGNIGPLFSHRIGSGDITQDQGAITIRYDQRIIQNPPAGLAEILGDLSSGQIAQ